MIKTNGKDVEIKMKKTLTYKDIKEIKYQCRMGYIIPTMIFIIGTVLAIVIFETTFNAKSTGLNTEIILILVAGFALLSFFISYKMNGKYFSDIRNNEKVIEIKIIQKKEFKTDYEAGSGTLYVGQEMKGFESFSIVVENCRYRVDKDLFLDCNEGDKVIFNYAPKSKHLINIELKNKARL